jgi:hypothetical protein
MRHLNRLVLAVMVMLALTGRMATVGAQSPAALDVAGLPEWRVTNSSAGGKLLLSDSPEMVPADGILYQDKVSGNVRLFFYHVNATDTAKRMEVLLENSGPETAHVVIRRSGLGGPGYSWMAVGKEAETSYLSGSQVQRISVPARGSAPLSAEISNTAVLPNMLINGIFDFTADRPVTVRVMMLPMLADSGAYSRQAKILPADEVHLRGTFEGADRRLVPVKIFDPLRDRGAVLTLADNEVDRYLEGIDATDGVKVLNYGNYGVVYEIFLPSKNTGKLACYLAPMGGPYAGAVAVKYGPVNQKPVATPPDRTFFGGYGTTDFALLGIFDGSQPLSFVFSPPGGSDLPVKFIILPQ